MSTMQTTFFKGGGGTATAVSIKADDPEGGGKSRRRDDDTIPNDLAQMWRKHYEDDGRETSQSILQDDVK